MTSEKEKLQDKDFAGEDGEVKSRKKIKRKSIGEEGSRKQTAIGILVTIVLSLVFYLPKEFKVWWAKWNTPETVTILKPVGDEQDVSEVLGFKVTIKEQTDAETVIEKLVEDLNGEYGVLVENLESGEGFSIKANNTFGAASLGKMPVLVEYYSLVDKGEIDPDEVYVLKEKDRWSYGTGSMQNQPSGTEYTYQEVAELVANQSDNMGAQLMSKWTGKKMPDEMTVEEVGRLFKDLYNGKLLRNESKEKLFDSLTDTVNEDRITAGVPSGVRVVHKFGSEVGVVNDCGIVYPPKGEAGADYVICLMSTEINEGEAQEVLPKISRVVWEWISR